MKFSHLPPLFIIVFLIIFSCKKPDEYPVEPSITFKSLSIIQDINGRDEKISVNISFTDGDGDLGYKPPGQNDAIFDDVSSPYYYNYIGTYSLLRNGVWVYVNTVPPKIPPDSVPISGRMPYLTPIGKNKSLKGEIACDLYLPIAATQDTFRLELFIYDRGLHKSNVIMTPEFIVNSL